MHLALATATPPFLYTCEENTAVCFDPDSGDTHLLSAFAAGVLNALGKEPISKAGLLQQIMEQVDFDAAGAIEPQTLAILEQLSALGLVTISD